MEQCLSIESKLLRDAHAHDLVATGIIFFPGVSFPEKFLRVIYDVASDNQMVRLNSAFIKDPE